MEFIWENYKLYTITDYTCIEELSPTEIEELVEYTSGLVE
jgi:hypothetical protein